MKIYACSDDILVRRRIAIYNGLYQCSKLSVVSSQMLTFIHIFIIYFQGGTEQMARLVDCMTYFLCSQCCCSQYFSSLKLLYSNFKDNGFLVSFSFCFRSLGLLYSKFNTCSNNFLVATILFYLQYYLFAISFYLQYYLIRNII